MNNLRDSHILNHKQNLEWNWLLIATILKVRLLSCSNTNFDCLFFFFFLIICCVFFPQWPNVNLRNNKDEHMHK